MRPLQLVGTESTTDLVLYCNNFLFYNPSSLNSFVLPWIHKVGEFWEGTLPLALAVAAEPKATWCCVGTRGRNMGEKQKKFGQERWNLGTNTTPVQVCVTVDALAPWQETETCACCDGGGGHTVSFRQKQEDPKPVKFLFTISLYHRLNLLQNKLLWDLWGREIVVVVVLCKNRA